ncbi:MAG TPA: hypothetical protein VHM70_19255 [Polyangiaceae bacterium]|nr:hypothetical protein [Polyangiaceae bacterium]
MGLRSRAERALGRPCLGVQVLLDIGRGSPHAAVRMARIELTKHLKALFPALEAAPFELDVTSVAQAVAALEALAPGVAFYICDERGRLRRHVNVFVDQEMICDRTLLSDALSSASDVFIAQALSGG